MFRADVPAWEYWKAGRWPTRPEGVPYPKGAARIKEKEPKTLQRTSYQLEGVLLKLKQGKYAVTGRYYTKVLHVGNDYHQQGSGCDGWTSWVKFEIFAEIIGTPPAPRKRRKRFVKPYTHPLDGAALNINMHLVGCNCWGCRCL